MKTIMVIIDGAESEDYRDCTWINLIGHNGEKCKVNNTPLGMEVNSLNCILNILGIPKGEIPKGRAYLESLAVGEFVRENDLVLRCNNVEIDNGILIGNKNEHNVKMKLPNGMRLVDMGVYKNLLIINDGRKYMSTLKTFAPHENIGRKIKDIMPSSGDDKIDSILKMLVSKYSLYPWGESVKEHIKSFEEIHNIKGCAVCKTEIVRGIAEAMKMYCAHIKGTTADIDTDLKAKAETALGLSGEYGFVLLHINGADESAHRRNRNEKLRFIKSIDKEVIKYLMYRIDEDTELIVTSDHGTSCSTGKHVNSEVSCYRLNKKKEVSLWLKK